ncbi:noncanonical pyrimidine nucleotidase, YjjG family [Polaribacter reichenbachii]|uniref:Haloacid dehalogenase n=1 Tax=Polaribacter reichenbachii TaxID=996801 RepID=A0A1B8TVY7_9FLAO|nr:YjjG family noncanonical pyrimidine nucleotidase [Polaribacter reichenbachii]APZ45079.1 noncanonical pyrimidine nucleotidase, YjjG family [Polaribacter reichenbachii]AUC18941.1 noncanonical pyrimidine nucleotidase, YjjG family [Polaribacter reichenbachii]OBY63901.1 haloacid dehalogenase [Polaribacter reichenbachii]
MKTIDRNKIKHIFFDLDHTLWDFEKNSELALQKVFKKQNISLNLDTFLEVYKPINLEFWRLFRSDKVTKSELRYGRLKKTFDALNYTISDDVIDTIGIEYIEFLPHFNYLFDGTFEILDYLKDKYKLHIITNGFQEVQLKKMESSKIIHYFDAIITSESVGVKKPNSEVFTYSLNLANAKSENSLMIGDSVEADILGALNVGMQALHCNFDNVDIKSQNFKSVTSLLEIKQYL